MQLRYYELVGKRVIAADGRKIGRITDLIAEGDGERLRVVALLVGSAGLIRRIMSKEIASGLRIGPLRQIPWALVASIEHGTVHLRNADGESVHQHEAILREAERIETVEQAR